MAFLLDTCAISEFVARFPNPTATQKMLALPREEIYLSAITIGELQEGVSEIEPCKRKTFLEDWFEHHVLTVYADRTLSFDVPEARRWGALTASLTKRGLTMQTKDSLLAATALVHNLTLVTRNEKHFAHTGVQIFNPWR